MFSDEFKLLNSNFQDYFNELQNNPWQIVTLMIDLILVGFLIYFLVRFVNQTRTWQLIKGIAVLIVINFISQLLQLRILTFILTSFMTYGVIALLIIFQPELRRALEQMGSNTGAFSKLWGMEKTNKDRMKEDIYKVAIACMELSEKKIGGLIVFERDIKLKDIIDAGIYIGAEVSPQLLVNIFVPKTPLHDGAVIISNNQIASAACILPLATDPEISKKFGTRHRAGIGITKESDAISIIISEETGKISIAKDGILISNVSEDALKRILIKHLVTIPFNEQEKKRRKARKQLEEVQKEKVVKEVEASEDISKEENNKE